MKTNTILQEDISLKDFHVAGHLSKQALFVCKRHGITFLSEIEELYKFDFSDFYIPHRWTKVETELRGLMMKWQDVKFAYNPDRLQHNFMIELYMFSSDQRETFEAYLWASMKNLSRRSCRALQEGTEFKAQIMIEFLLDKECSFGRLPNVGKKSQDELENFRLDLIRFINKLHNRGQADPQLTEL